MVARVNIIVTLVLIVVLTSCSNTRFLSVWVENDLKMKPVDNVMVIGIGKNQLARRMFEDRFVSELAKEKINALASFKYIPDGTRITRESVEKAIKDKSIDAVIITHLVAIEEETIYHPPMTHVTPNSYYGYYYNYYPTVHSYIQSPGYYSTNKLVKLETSLYDANSASLLWSAQSSTFNPGSVKDVVNPLIKLVIKDLKKHKILNPPLK